MKSVFWGNYKGGVGKTTSTYNVAVELAKKFEQKVLLVDLDPQSSLSDVCMTAYGKQLDEIEKCETLNYIYMVYMQAKKTGITNFVLSSKKIVKRANGISFIPNSLFSPYGGLDKISMDIGKSTDNLLILRDFIVGNNFDEEYDFIFFDCPPSNNLITQSAFLYSDYYIIPTIMDPLSSKGVKHYISVVKKIYENYCKNSDCADILSLLFGNEPQLIGIFETMRKGNTNTKKYRTAIKSIGYLFEREIKDLKDVSEKAGEGSEASNYEYVNLAKEFLNRLKYLEEGNMGVDNIG
ncbi:MAG: ParA family protein [Oscillospiraceae bacterium]|nr:ParA family protein [Oscillospiraceae bacterium]